MYSLQAPVTEGTKLFTSCLTYDTELNCFEQWVERVFRFFERYIRENSRAGKRKATQYNTAKLTQPRPNTTAPSRRDTACEKRCEQGHVFSVELSSEFLRPSRYPNAVGMGAAVVGVFIVGRRVETTAECKRDHANYPENDTLSQAKVFMSVSVNTTHSQLQVATMHVCLLYTSPSPRDRHRSRMPSSA